jgi:hypothetical protein
MATKTESNKKSTAKKATKTKDTPKQDNLLLAGLDNVTISDVMYIGIEGAIDMFDYLWNYDKSWYVRKTTKLNKEQLQQYEKSLTVPKTGNTSYLRNLNPFLIWKKDGKHYLINGNSRFQMYESVYERNDNTEISPIGYQIVEGELTKEIVERLQYSLNDTTRPNSPIEKYKRIIEYLNQGYDRSYICQYFDVLEQEISNAKTLLQNPIPELLADMIDSGTATTEGAVKVMQTAKALELDPEMIIGLSLTFSKKGKVTQGSVTKWRKHYEDEQARLKAEAEAAEQAKQQADAEAAEQAKAAEQRQNVNDVAEETEILDEVVREFDESETEEAETPAVIEVPKIDMSSLLAETNPSQIGLMMRIAAQYISSDALSDEKRSEIHESMKALLLTISKDLPETEKAKIQSVL